MPILPPWPAGAVAKLTRAADAQTTTAHGNFANNAFLFTPPSTRIEFLPIISEFSGHADAVFAELKASLRVEDVSAYSQA